MLLAVGMRCVGFGNFVLVLVRLMLTQSIKCCSLVHYEYARGIKRIVMRVMQAMREFDMNFNIGHDTTCTSVH